MYFHEEKQNLLDVPQGYWIAHCISGDFALGAGVAKQLDETFNLREALLSEWGEEEGNCVIPHGNVLNIVTKRRYWQKPTLASLKEALQDMKLLIGEEKIKRIAMPRIGCGLDRLNWDDVSAMIQEVFGDLDIEIMVCYL